MLEARDAESIRTAPAAPQSEASVGTPHAARFTVRDGERFVLLRTAELDWIEASANYLRFHVGAKVFQVRMTMAELERRLDPAQFCRIHRSTIVNLDRVREIKPEWHGEYQVVLTTGATLRLSRSYRDRLLRHSMKTNMRSVDSPRLPGVQRPGGARFPQATIVSGFAADALTLT
jgi:two-component system LytT family response regulator